MQKTLILLSLLFFSVACFSQAAPVKQSQKKIKTVQSDTAKTDSVVGLTPSDDFISMNHIVQLQKILRDKVVASQYDIVVQELVNMMNAAAAEYQRKHKTQNK